MIIEQADVAKRPGKIFRYSLLIEIPYAPDYEKVHNAIAGAIVEAVNAFGVGFIAQPDDDRAIVGIKNMGRVN